MVLGAAGYTLLLLVIIVYTIGDGSIEIFSFEGLEFFTSTDWNAVYGRDAFGALPYIVVYIWALVSRWMHCPLGSGG